MFRKVLSFIKKNRLIVPGQRILVALSGGADSVALFHILHKAARKYNFKLIAAHLNHCIRGKEADEDEKWVKWFCRKLKHRCITGRINVPVFAEKRKLSIETAGREIRYKFLSEVARKVDADVIATAHHADDQAETVLMRFLRGAGTKGLSGIQPAILYDGFPVVRPLLETDKQEVLRYLKRNNLIWREDSTNAEASYLRNKIRHKLIPLLEKEYNPAIKRMLIRTAEIFSSEDRLLDSLALETMLKHIDSFDNTALNAQSIAKEKMVLLRRVVRLWLEKRGFPAGKLDFEIVERICMAIKGQKKDFVINLPDGWFIKRKYGVIYLYNTAPAVKAADIIQLKVPGITRVPFLKIRVSAYVKEGIVKERCSIPGSLPASASLSLEVIEGMPIYVRTWRAGDRMKPFGTTGSRKLQDIFTDAKIPKEKRRFVPVFECGGEIIWIPGYRIARGYEVLGEKQRALRLYCNKI